jgi:N-acetylglucosamine-6-phosphate deacetylase
MNTDHPGDHSSRFALVNGRLVLPHEVVEGLAIVIEGDRIMGLTREGNVGSDCPRVDVAGRLVTPGLIDLHTHGALGHSFNEPATEAYEVITTENARRGVTALLATLSAASIPHLQDCLRFCRQWMAAPHAGARVLGAYIEGPYLSQAQKGAQDAACIRMPDDGTADLWLEYRDVLRIMALAPELPGAEEFIGRLAGAGIIPAVGHSSARDSDVHAAMRVGLRHVTHLWSAQSATFHEGPWRRAGVVEAALASEGLTAEMICDNRHLPPTQMKLAYKCLGPDRLCAVSDAIGGAGLPEGARFHMGAMEYQVRDGVSMTLDGRSLAGSSTLLNEMLPVLTDVVGIPLVAAVRMVTLTPATILGLQGSIGSIAAGKDADLVVFNPDFSVWRTMIGGRRVYGPGSTVGAHSVDGAP